MKEVLAGYPAAYTAVGLDFGDKRVRGCRLERVEERNSPVETIERGREDEHLRESSTDGCVTAGDAVSCRYDIVRWRERGGRGHRSRVLCEGLEKRKSDIWDRLLDPSGETAQKGSCIAEPAAATQTECDHNLGLRQ